MKPIKRPVGFLALALTVFWLIAGTGIALADDKQSDSLAADDSRRFLSLRQKMVQSQLIGRDITDRAVLAAMTKVPRHEFVPLKQREQAYQDNPLPIGHGQTISQPYIVALMTQTAGLSGKERCLEIGTGSGYQAAVLAEICSEVFSIEIICPLAETATATLKRLEYKNVTVKCGDGYQGWSEQAPFDVVLVTAAADHVPKPLLDQLVEGGRLIMPVGGSWMQSLERYTKRAEKIIKEDLIPVRFVPLTGPLKEEEQKESGGP